MKKYIIFLLSVVCLFLAIAVPAAIASEHSGEGNALTVDINGTGMYRSIQDAIDHAQDGATIEVSPGIYYETLNISKPVSIVSEDSENTIIDIGNNNIGVLVETHNAAISGLTIRNGKYGIELLNSSECTLRNIRLDDNVILGLIVNGGYDHDIDTSNTINGDPIYYYYGIHSMDPRLLENNAMGTLILANCSDIAARNNTFRHNDGITLSGCHNVTLAGNKVLHPTEFAIWVDDTFDNNIGPDNTVDNKPIYYFHDLQGTSSEPIKVEQLDAGSIILGNCRNLEVSDNILHNSAGIVLINSNENLVHDNKIWRDEPDKKIQSSGVYLDHSQNDQIYKNIVNNFYNGIQVRNSDNNIIRDNDVHDNRQGIYLLLCENDTISGNMAYGNDIKGIYILNSWECLVTRNNASHNQDGISLDRSSGCEIVGNVAEYNDFSGIGFEYSSDCIVQNNTAQNERDGIFQFYSNNCTISGNILRFNSFEGIYSDTSTYTRIVGNLFENNNQALFGANETGEDIIDNKAINNYGNGFYVQSGSLVSFENNSIVNNPRGIDLLDVDSPHISNNSISKNGAGISLQNCSGSDITNNQIFSNIDYGINIEDSGNERIINNSIYANNAGIKLARSDRISILNNDIYMNSIGVRSSADKDISIHQNNFISNDQYQVFGDAGSTVNATDNWWGSQSNSTIQMFAGDVDTHSPLNNPAASFFHGNECFILITSPSDRSIFRFGDKIDFYSDYVGIVPECTYVWIADNSEIIGSERAIQVDGLSPGVHDIAIKATEKNGRMYSNNITIAVNGDNDIVISDDETYKDQVVMLNESIIIKDGGAMRLDNVTIVFECLVNGQYGILAEPGSIVEINNSSILSYYGSVVPYDRNIAYYFNVKNGSHLRLTGSYIDACGYRFSDIFTEGMCIEADDAFIENNTFKNNYNGLILRDVKNITIKNNDLFNNVDGIYMLGSDHNLISNNYFYGNGHGIFMEGSDSNTFMNNWLFSNSIGGIATFGNSTNNSIHDNRLSSSINGIQITESTGNNVYGNTINDTYIGISVARSDRNTVDHNTIYDINSEGICIVNANDNLITNNNIDNALNGINIQWSRENTIGQNNIQNCYFNGIPLLKNSNGNTIIDNVLINDNNGIVLHSSNDSLVFNNTMTRNRMTGIFVAYSKNNTITGNNASYNNEYGFYIADTNSNIRISASDNVAIGNKKGDFFLHPKSVSFLEPTVIAVLLTFLTKALYLYNPFKEAIFKVFESLLKPIKEVVEKPIEYVLKKILRLFGAGSESYRRAHYSLIANVLLVHLIDGNEVYNLAWTRAYRRIFSSRFIIDQMSFTNLLVKDRRFLLKNILYFIISIPISISIAFLLLISGLEELPYMLPLIIEFVLILLAGIIVEAILIGKTERVRSDLEFESEPDILREEIKKRATGLEARFKDKKLNGHRYASEMKKLSEVEAIVEYLDCRRYYLRFTEHGYLKAIEAFEALREKGSNDALVLAGLAEAYAMLGFWKEMTGTDPGTLYGEAYALSEAAVALEPETYQAHRAFAMALYHKKEHARCKEEAGKALHLNPLDAESYVLLARVHEDIRERIRLYEKALKLNSSLIIANRCAAMAYLKIGRLDRAEAHLLKVISLNGDDPVAHAHLGRIYRTLGRTVEAIHEYRSALDIYPEYVGAFEEFMDLLRSKGMMTEAILETEKIVARSMNKD